LRSLTRAAGNPGRASFRPGISEQARSSNNRRNAMVRRFAVLVAAASLIAMPVGAAEVGGVKLDDKASVGGQELVLNGAGIRTRAIFKVYVGSLYVPAKAQDLAGVLAKAPRRVQLNLLRNLSPDQLVDALVEGLKENNSEAEFAAVKKETDQLVSIMKAFGDVKEGNVVTLDFVDGATKIGFNGTAKGSIPGEAFNKALVKVWLGDRPVQADLKKAMLGG
jgi:long-chain acyl-CoA synthetase